MVPDKTHTPDDEAASTLDSLLVEHGYGNRFQGFQNLMRLRIRDILLVSSLYDLYLFEEDGHTGKRYGRGKGICYRCQSQQIPFFNRTAAFGHTVVILGGFYS